MNMPMPIQLLEALHSATGPLIVTDEERQRSYILLPTEAFARLHGLLGNDDFTAADLLPAALEATDSDWNAPGMEAYDRYDENRSTP